MITMLAGHCSRLRATWVCLFNSLNDERRRPGRHGSICLFLDVIIILIRGAGVRTSPTDGAKVLAIFTAARRN